MTPQCTVRNSVITGAITLVLALPALATAQQREILNLPAQPPTARMSADLQAVVNANAVFVGVTRAGRPVVRPSDGIATMETAIKGLKMDVGAVSAPLTSVTELIVSLTVPDAPLTLPDGAILVRRAVGLSYGVVRAPAGVTAGLLRALAEQSQVVRIEPNYPFFAAAQSTSPNDPDYKDQWGLRTIRAPQAWQKITSAKPIVIAILDSGIDINHPDLIPNLWNTKKHGYFSDGLCPGEVHGCDFTRNSHGPLQGDPEGHGTHIAGVIGAVGNNDRLTTGVAWEATLLGVQVLEADLSTTADQIVRGLEYAMARKAKIITMSFGAYTESTELTKAVHAALNQGALIVAAAGNIGNGVNRNNDVAKIYPASIQSPGRFIFTF